MDLADPFETTIEDAEISKFWNWYFYILQQQNS
jgi:hypothetical protein